MRGIPEVHRPIRGPSTLKPDKPNILGSSAELVGKDPFPGSVLGGSTAYKLVVQKRPFGLVDESFEAVFALRAVWTARGQHPCCPPSAHTLRPIVHTLHKAYNRIKIFGLFSRIRGYPESNLEMVSDR